MTVFELINFNRELLDKFRKAGIRPQDVRYVDLYADYVRMIGRGEKNEYVVAVLGKKYGVSERTIYNIKSKFEKDCKSFAV